VKDILVSWDQFKAIVIGVKELPVNCLESKDSYELFAVDGQLFWKLILVKGSKEAEDFAKNHKKNCNKKAGH